jgi:hypothetical protein
MKARRVAPAGFIKAVMIGQLVSKVKLSTQHFGDGPTMTKNSSTPDAVLVAIDMSKHRQEVLIERPEGGAGGG